MAACGADSSNELAIIRHPLYPDGFSAFLLHPNTQRRAVDKVRETDTLLPNPL